MKKKEFLKQLRESLQALTETEREEAIGYYSEMIEDFMEEGKTEEEAIAELGTLEEIVKKVLENYEGPMYKSVSSRREGDRSLLILLCSPVILILACLVFSLFLVLYALAFAGFVLAISFGIVAVAAFASAGIEFFRNMDLALFQVGMALFCMGLSFCLTPLMTKAFRGITGFAHHFGMWIKNVWKEVK